MVCNSLIGCQNDFAMTSKTQEKNVTTCKESIYDDTKTVEYLTPSITVKEIKKKLNFKEKEGGDKFSVAVIDSGVYKHCELENKIIYFKDYVNGKIIPYDDSGHGTEVSGIIAEMNENIELVELKVLDQYNRGTTENIIQALEWVLKNKSKYKIKVLNVSVGIFDVNKQERKKLNGLCNELVKKGISIVTSAGNFTYFLRENELANIENVISVGSCIYDKDNIRIDDYSQCWIRLGKVIPTVCTFGDSIVTIESNVLYKGNENEKISDRNMHTKVSGTSFSTAIVTGYICNTIGENKNISVEEIIKKVKNGKTVYSDQIKKNISILE